MRDANCRDGDAVRPAEPDQRVAPRFTLLLRMGKLISDEGEFLCIVRDVSETGLSVKLFHPLPHSQNMVLEFPNGDQHRIQPVWQEDGKAGFRFAEIIDIARVIEGPSPFPRRPVRVNVTAAAQLDIGGRSLPVEIRNLSQQGALIGCGERLPIYQRLVLRADGMPDIRAKVRWRRSDECGLVFEDTFQFGELAEVVFTLQGMPGAAATEPR